IHLWRNINGKVCFEKKLEIYCGHPGNYTVMGRDGSNISCAGVVSSCSFSNSYGSKRSIATFFPHVRATFLLSVSGFLLGATVGLIVAVFLHLFKWVKEIFYPFLILSQNIPIIVLAPLLVIWLGFGAMPKLIVITLACFFPIAMSTLEAFEQTDRKLYFYLEMMG